MEKVKADFQKWDKSSQGRITLRQLDKLLSLLKPDLDPQQSLTLLWRAFVELSDQSLPWNSLLDWLGQPATSTPCSKQRRRPASAGSTAKGTNVRQGPNHLDKATLKSETHRDGLVHTESSHNRDMELLPRLEYLLSEDFEERLKRVEAFVDRDVKASIRSDEIKEDVFSKNGEIKGSFETNSSCSQMSTAAESQPGVSQSMSYLCPWCKTALPSFEAAAAHCNSNQQQQEQQQQQLSASTVSYLCPTCKAVLPSYEQAAAHCQPKPREAWARTVQECQRSYPSELQGQWWGHLKQLRGDTRNNLAKSMRNCPGSLLDVSLPELSCNYEAVIDAHRLGSGSFGTVLLMHPRYSPKEDHAVKLIPMTEATAGEQGLRQEVSAMLELNHPCIVSILGLYKCIDLLPGQASQIEYFCLAMPRACGHTLSEHIETPQPKVALYIARQLCNALAYMHEQEICHGDIWSENIMVTDIWEVTLIDLGCAKTFGSRRVNEVSRRKINLSYAAPEALEGRPLVPPQDCWPVGLVIAEVAMGTMIVNYLEDGSEVKPQHQFHISLIQTLDQLRLGLGSLLDPLDEKRATMLQAVDILGPETTQYVRATDPSPVTVASADLKRRLRLNYAPSKPAVEQATETGDDSSTKPT